VLYATGEESVKQVALRARRLGLEASTSRLAAETCVETLVAAATELHAQALIVDSIQTMYSERVEAAPGAVSQLRECTAELVRFAKASGTAVLLVGHVTKEGQIAGPRVLEHMVGQESIRRGQRNRRIRDAGDRPARSDQPVGNLFIAS